MKTRAWIVCGWAAILMGIAVGISACADEPSPSEEPTPPPSIVPTPDETDSLPETPLDTLPEMPKLWEGFSENSDYIVVIGDVQAYVSSSKNLKYFEQTMRWVKEQKNLGANIKSMLFVGDLTENNKAGQWKTFQEAASIASGDIMMIPVSGNHDYDWDRNNKERPIAVRDRRSCHISEYASTPLLRANIVASFRPDSIENIIVRQEIDGKEIDVVALEFGVRPDALQWAADYVKDHPDHRFVVMTHELMRRTGEFGDSSARIQFEGYQPYSMPEDVWKALGAPTSNVIAMLCGHNGFAAINTTRTNVTGRSLPVVLFNLQYLVNGGDGLVQLWEFPHGTNDVIIRIVDSKVPEYFMAPAEMDPPCCEFPIRFSYN